MITLREYKAENKATWNAFNKVAKNGIFMFDRDFMDYHSHKFVDNSLMFYENEKLIALLPLNLKIVSKSNNIESNVSKNETKILDSNFKDSKLSQTLQNLNSTQKILYSHEGLTFGGFITDKNMKQHKMLECFALLKEYMKEQNIDKLIYKALPYIYHSIPADEDIYALFRNNARIYRIDCTSTILLSQTLPLSKGRKAQISRAKQSGIKVTKSNDLESFCKLLCEVLKHYHNATPTHSLAELQLLCGRFENEIALYSATLQGQMIAAALIFNYSNLAHTQYLCANAMGRELGGLDLLLKSLIDSYLGSKMYFDFGISNENNGLFLNEGLIAQKESFGARSVAHYFYEMLLDSTNENHSVTYSNNLSNTYGGGVSSLFIFYKDSIYPPFLWNLNVLWKLNKQDSTKPLLWNLNKQDSIKILFFLNLKSQDSINSQKSQKVLNFITYRFSKVQPLQNLDSAKWAV
ncbi:GNAT family N-acetyltransferase [Helicobacter saguini]|uniref:GNAT family N-acetyltransferase n=1 Tax=Helicobacter saguini TaxID=1548018 RepID=UPI000E57A430|nr:GNAT family N-acetyltransferase [Helicobacter saguini]MWV72485.1 GNAT family N-acetyltransferase [Helicobacter saguini]